MCRAGGRRCPSHSDPVAIAARNARRRATYAAQRGKTTPAQNAAGETGGNQRAKSPAPRASTTTTPTTQAKGTTKKAPQKQALGITRRKAPWDQDDLYTSEVISGVINYRELTPESYKEFGFENPQERDLASFAHERFTDYLSQKFDESITVEQRKSLRLYTQEHYEWVNRHSYHPETIAELSETAPDGRRLEQVFEVKDKASLAITSGGYSRELLAKVTQEMDAGLAAAPKRQKIVYRGLSFHEMGGEDALQGDMGKWLDSERSVGTEFVVEGYASTSANSHEATHFARKSRVIYEILTPEGAPVRAMSDLPEEEEVLLPRKQRYMVVGLHKKVETSKGPYSVVQIVAINSRGEILDGTNSDPLDPLIPTQE